MGITRQDFALFPTVARMVSADLRVNTRAELNGGARFVIESANRNGILLSNGLYANPVNLTTANVISSNLDLPVNSVIETVGYSAPGDNGGAKWVRTNTTGTPSQTPAQLGNALLNDASGGQWELLHNGTINVLKLGASHNNNVSSIANAAVSNLLTRGGGDVFYPPISGNVTTTYIADQTINVASKVIHASLNWNVEIRAANNLNNDIFKSLNFDTLTLQNMWLVSDGVQDGCGFRDIRINGNKANQTSGRGVALYCKRLNVTNLCIHDCFGDGWYSEAGDIPGQQGFQDLPEGKIEVYCRNNGGDGFRFLGPHDSRIVKLVSNENDGRGAFFDRDPGVYSGSCDISFAHIYANQMAGIVIDENNNIRAETLISESNFQEGVIWNGDNSQVANIQMYNNCRTSGSYHFLLAQSARANKFGTMQIRDNQGAGGLSIGGTENEICSGLFFGGSTGLIGLNVESTASRNNVSMTIQDCTTAIANNGASESNNFTISASNVGLVFNNATSSFGNAYDISYNISGTQNILTGFGAAVDDSEEWNVRGFRDGVKGVSKVRKQSGANIDLSSTSEQTISIALELIATPRLEDVRAGIVYTGTDSTWSLDYLTVFSISQTLVTFKVKLGTATAGSETAKISTEVRL